MKEDMSIEFIDFISVCSPLIPPICEPASRASERTHVRVSARARAAPDAGTA